MQRDRETRSPAASAGPTTGDDGRFDRQVRFAELGPEGQARLAGARAAIVGCGALGGAMAQWLHRAGVGRLTLVDRDVVEVSNLPRQVLFDESHARAGAPKAEAAAETLARAGGPTVLAAHTEQLDASNVARLLGDCDCVLDGTDNLATRYLLNDHALESGKPYVYAGVVGSHGVVFPVLPHRGPCLRCLFPEPPPPGSLPTCDTAGVLGPAVGLVAAWAAGRALRLLASGDPLAAVEPTWVELDPWKATARTTAPPRAADCPACAGERRFLHAPASEAVVLCGRNAVQLPPPREAPDLEELERRWRGGREEVLRARSFLRWNARRPAASPPEAHPANGGRELSLTLFRDGRALVEGTQDEGRARALYDRLVGA